MQLEGNEPESYHNENGEVGHQHYRYQQRLYVHTYRRQSVRVSKAVCNQGGDGEALRTNIDQLLSRNTTDFCLQRSDLILFSG